MSSKLLDEENARNVTSLLWREVRSKQEVQRPAAEAAPDLAATIEQLERQCEERVQHTRSAALREGEAAGHRKASAEIQPVIDRLSRTIEELAQLRSRLRREAEADLVRLSMAIARRVLRREISIDPEALHGLILGALEKFAGQEISRVRVHPSDVAKVTAGLQRSSAGASVEVLGDPSREPGTVIFETERGNLDCSVESQLQEIERGLTDRLARQS